MGRRWLDQVHPQVSTTTTRLEQRWHASSQQLLREQNQALKAILPIGIKHGERAPTQSI